MAVTTERQGTAGLEREKFRGELEMQRQAAGVRGGVSGDSGRGSEVSGAPGQTSTAQMIPLGRASRQSPLNVPARLRARPGKA